MIPSWARPGAKVVCVDDSDIPPPAPYTKWESDKFDLVKGDLYTINGISMHRSLGIPCVILKELGIRSVSDDGYALYRFRPVIEQKDDIALFTHLLNTTSEDQPIKEEA